MAKKRTTKRRAKKTIEPEPYFIGLSDPVELRKHILEPTREVIQFLQSYEQFQKTKQEKTQAILQLKDDLKQIKTIFNKLKQFFPKSKIQAERASKKIKEEIKEEQKLPPEKPALKKPVPIKPPTEIQALEKELGEIEKKLGTLSE